MSMLTTVLLTAALRSHQPVQRAISQMRRWRRYRSSIGFAGEDIAGILAAT
jgi:hypothetical protein